MFPFQLTGLSSICFTDGLHMHDKSNVFGANCAHAAAICLGLLGVRQPGSALAPAGLLAIWKPLMHSQALFPLFPLHPTPLFLPSLSALFQLALCQGIFGEQTLQFHSTNTP